MLDLGQAGIEGKENRFSKMVTQVQEGIKKDTFLYSFVLGNAEFVSPQLMNVNDLRFISFSILKKGSTIQYIVIDSFANQNHLSGIFKEQLRYLIFLFENGFSLGRYQNYLQKIKEAESQKESPSPAPSKVPGVQKQEEKPAVISTIHGLKNIGNSCFMNAALQSFFSLDGFNAALLNYSNRFVPGSLPAEYIKLLEKITAATERVVDPNPVCQVGWKVMGFAHRTQQDANEFIVQFLTEVSTVEPIKNLFGIGIQTYLNNQVGNLSASSTLNLPIIGDSLIGSLSSYFSIEDVERGGQVAKKQSRIAFLGKYLILQLNRYTYNAQMKSVQKIVNPVSFPLKDMNLNSYADKGVPYPCKT